MDTNTIQKTIDLNAPIARVWRALTDHTQFGEWFHVRIDSPFQPGQVSHGQITHPGYEHLQWQVTVQKLEPQHTFSFTWHPYAIDPAVDYTNEPPTLVQFTLEPIPTGTRLTVTESGFDNIPAHRRAEALRMNTNGWAAQITNIQTYVADHP